MDARHDTLFTPPPWKVDSYWDGSFKITRDLEPGIEPRYRKEYDRRLIEAAPDLFLAAELTVLSLKQGLKPSEDTPLWLVALESALKKAGGQT
jgi:hypothetical protein